MQTRTNAVFPFKPAADQRGLEGYFVDAAGVAMAVANARPFGLILDGGDIGQTTSVALCGGGFSGLATVKLAAEPGEVLPGNELMLVAGGTVAKAAGAPGEIIVAVALEAGSGGERIEAVLVRPFAVGPDGIDDDSIAAAKLHPAVAARMPDTTIDVANTGAPDGVAHITGQVRDAHGEPLAGRFIITLWLATSGAWAAPADLGALTAKANSLILKVDTEDALVRIRTHSDGSWGAELDTAIDGTIHAHALVSGPAVTANAAITGN